LDLTSGEKTKSAFNDIQEGQQTFFTNYIYEHGNDEDKQLLSSCLGKQVNEEQIVQLKELFERTGALQAGKELILSLNQKARELFNEIPLVNMEAKEGFEQLINKMEHLS
jgi:geranylgeranyl pyrophosphate synthase